MAKSHLKRHAMPSTWKIKRKGITFIARPKPAGHSMENSLTILSVMRDILGLTKTAKEVKYVIGNTEVLVNGRKVHDLKRSLGLLEVLAIPSIKKSYRMIMGKNRKLDLIEIDGNDASRLILKITGKTVLKGGRVQLNFFGGHNIIVDKDEFRVQDSVVIDIGKNIIADRLSFEKGSTAYLFGGKHKSDSGKIEDISGSKFIYKNASGEMVETMKKYAIVVGKDKPLIKLND